MPILQWFIPSLKLIRNIYKSVEALFCDEAEAKKKMRKKRVNDIIREIVIGRLSIGMQLCIHHIFQLSRQRRAALLLSLLNPNMKIVALDSIDSQTA